MIKKTTAALLAFATLFGAGVYAETQTNTAADAVYTSLENEDILKSAVSLGIVDAEKKEWNESITREQFCEYTFNMLNGIKELPTAKLSKNPFDDVTNYKINILSFVGILSGKGDGKFAPGDKLSREEAAVILSRAAKYSEVDLPLAKVDASYSDNTEISPWALSDVYSLKLSNIIEDTENGFKPKANISEEDAVRALVKLHNIIKK